MTRRPWQGIWLSAVFVLAACVASGGSSPEPSLPPSSPTVAKSAVASAPSPTRQSASGAAIDDSSAMQISNDYCRRLGDWVREHESLAADIGLKLAEIPVTCTDASGKTVLCKFGASPPRTIRATTESGQTFEESLPCGGIPSSAICYEQPPLMAQGMEGYWDVPCSGEPPNGCATPVAIDPDAREKARPLTITAIKVPVDPPGHHEIEIGRAALPNGVLSHASFDLAEKVQDGFIIESMHVRLLVEPTDPDRPPFKNVFDRGRFPGVEEVKVVLVFDVQEASPSAVLHISNVDVR
jgi:hypothetical protein